MPHAVLLGATRMPALDVRAPLSRGPGAIHRIVEVLEGPGGLVLKSLLVQSGASTRFLVRIDRREDGLVVRLDDHLHVARTPEVFDHLALVAARILEANPGARLGPTNLADRIGALVATAGAHASPKAS